MVVRANTYHVNIIMEKNCQVYFIMLYMFGLYFAYSSSSTNNICFPHTHTKHPKPSDGIGAVQRDVMQEKHYVDQTEDYERRH